MKACRAPIGAVSELAWRAPHCDRAWHGNKVTPVKGQPRTPFFDSARKLLELGAEPNDLLIMRHRSSSTTSLRARVGVAAKLAVHETNAGPRYVLGEIWRTGAEVDC
jgi:hypothetical protein